MRKLAAALAIIAAGCSTAADPESVECENAAVAQAAAEMRMGELIEQHEAIHKGDGGDHDDSAALIAGARVDLIIAEAETRHNCG